MELGLVVGWLVWGFVGCLFLRQGLYTALFGLELCSYRLLCCSNNNVVVVVVVVVG